MWVQSLLLLRGADPDGRIDGMCAHMGVRRAVAPLSEESAEKRGCTLFFWRLLG